MELLGQDWARASAGFVSGTLVHAREGLIAIEKLKVGDWVLSAPQVSHGVPAYKRVVKVAEHHDQVIISVRCRVPDKANPGKVSYKRVTGAIAHFFWTDEEGWTPAVKLGGSYSGPCRVRLADGASTDLDGRVFVYATDQLNIGWIASNGKHGEGWLFDFNTGQFVTKDDVPYDAKQWCVTDEDMWRGFRTTVYSIEVEDHHTYFVGAHGLWVRDGLNGGTGQ